MIVKGQKTAHEMYTEYGKRLNKLWEEYRNAVKNVSSEREKLQLKKNLNDMVNKETLNYIQGIMNKENV